MLPIDPARYSGSAVKRPRPTSARKARRGDNGGDATPVSSKLMQRLGARAARRKSRLREADDESNSKSDEVDDGTINPKERQDHLQHLFLKKSIRDRVLKSLQHSDSVASDSSISSVERVLAAHGTDDDSLGDADRDMAMLADLKREIREELDGAKESAKVKELNAMMRQLQGVTPHVKYPLEVRLENVTYTVQVDDSQSRIATVYNSSFLYPLYKWFKHVALGEAMPVSRIMQRPIIQDVSLCLQPGKNYLVLGPPASGKSTLLKAIAGQLKSSSTEKLEGQILYNGRELEVGRRQQWYIENAFAYIDQLDKHAPRLTVDETFEFSFQCKTGGTFQQAQDPRVLQDPKVMTAIQEADRSRLGVNMVLASLGLTEVRDTFVGNTAVRGVSGGQRRRVTVGEMITSRQPVLCGDEISTGLDAASTFDMVQVLTHFGKLAQMTRVFALLQPSPETFSLFDEIILVSEGLILYAGPIDEVEDYFAELGYRSPQFMDVADFLQTVSTEDGKKLYHPVDDSKRTEPPTVADLANCFKTSQQGKKIRDRLDEPPQYVWKQDDRISQHGSIVSQLTLLKQVKKKYANSFFRNTWLNLKRFLLLWTRDKRVIFASAVKNILMGVSVGGVFRDVDDEVSILGALFQSGLFIMLGAMQSASGLVNDRVIFYKQMDANFFSSWPYTLGRTLAGFPQTIMDVFTFGTILYFMVGLSDRAVTEYFLFIAILMTFAMMMNMQLAVFASFAPDSQLQVYSACTLLLLILFGGYIVAPDAIPSFYLWIYWWNPFAWAYRALVINEFRSPRWDDPDATLAGIGFVYGIDSRPFEQDWLGYCFLYMTIYFFGCVVLTAVSLGYVRQIPEPTPPDVNITRLVSDPVSERRRVNVPFKPVTLSFADVCYEVKASTKNETLKLLNGVNGIFRSGRMCALMGSSGAGKTTLLDVIALRKRTGSVTGDVRLNGWSQDKISFCRCSGYVEQFDVQSPELTVRETILFSARLRLDRDVVTSEEDREAFVDQVIDDMELLPLADSLVGSDEGIGLSFEQKKRLSIAVELAASPSVVFLDEPTSGLDARSALLVVRALRNISDKGQTIVATIHQPSSAIFEMFDELLLLKRGGQVVFQGDLGKDCSRLVNYFENLGATKIELGENPANWMLRVITSEDMGDLAQKYVESKEYALLRKDLDEIKAVQDPELKIEYKDEFAASKAVRQLLVNGRLRLIYWRSPAYNLSRLMVSMVIAFVLGSVFILVRHPEIYTEVEMRSRLSVIFLTFIITGIMAILSVIPVMTKIREMFYRHQDSGMYDSAAIGWALGSAEKLFIVLATTIFTVVFLSVAGMTKSLRGLFGFWGFFTFNFAIYSYFGQAFVCLVENPATALILSSVFIGLNNFFAGLIVRPQLLVGSFFAFPFYITPGQYVYEGMVTSLYKGSPKIVTADVGGGFFEYLVDTGVCVPQQPEPCQGTVSDFIDVFFGGVFTDDHISRNALILGGILILTRVLTFAGLKYIRYN